MTPLGIDDLHIYASTLRLDMATLAEARGFSDDQVQGTGFAARSVTPPWEDPVTLATNAPGISSTRRLCAVTLLFTNSRASAIRSSVSISSPCRRLKLA